MNTFTKMNKNIVFRLFGFLLILESFFIFLSFIVSIIYKENTGTALLIAFSIAFLTGICTVIFTRHAKKDFGKHEGFLIISLVWIIFSLFGSLPFILSGAIPNFTNAFFETMSGFTTTGASIINNIEELPKSILFWRSIIQWIGGMGFILLSLAIMPFLGVGGVQLYSAETAGLPYDKMHPKVKETAQRLWIIYVGFTLVEILLLWLGGMTIFDSVNHSFTTMSTGGFSTKQASIVYFSSPFIQYVIIIFMFIAGVNFTLPYFILKFEFKRVLANEEFRYYTLITLFFAIIITVGLYLTGNFSFENSIRTAFFQVISVLSTTGFVSNNYLLWPSFLIGLLFTLMFVGSSSGSTGGGVKVIRILLILKNCYYELKRLIHPKAIIPIRINEKTVPQPLINNVISFIVFYMLIFMVGSIFMSFVGLDVQSAMGSVAASLGNIGHGLGSVGPGENYSLIATSGKWMLSILMLLGRLELFAILVLFSPVFWKK